MLPSTDLSKHLPLDPAFAALPLKFRSHEKVPPTLKGLYTQAQWEQMIQAFLQKATIGTLWDAFSKGFDHLLRQQEELSEHASISERLHAAIAKEEALERLITLQKQWVKELVAKGENSGQLIGMNEAAKALDLAPSSLRHYADQGIVPCFKFGRNRKFNLAEVREAMEKARQDGKIPRLTDAMRKKLLR